ncbi:oligogalacturonate-specific porin KdgM family protein [Musicola keenii]|uniref:oligogalacturonate-specific porin KdgM family protein n=1 Tax=Musicola keenii TaxID=2884250 RepID=UPI0017819C6D|nr:oligogalacturonate-specific porin KdgM family protein [Musicola keenii]
MKFKILTMMVASLVSMSSMAVTIDYRHEMKDTAKADHKDRLLISHRFDNGFGLSSEASWKNGASTNQTTPNKPYNEMVSNETEVIASYLYNFNKTFSLESGLSYVTSSSSANYRPYVRAKANVINDLTMSLRYRPYFKRYSSNIGVSGKDTSESGYTFTGNIDYTFLKDYTIGYELEYAKTTKAGVSYYRYDNDSDNFDHNVKLSYKWDKNWKPYMEVGNVAQDGTSDHRQTRYRVGVQYNF